MDKFRFGLTGIDDDEWSWHFEGHDGERWIDLGDGCEYSRREAVANIRAVMAKHGATAENTIQLPF